MAWTLFAVPGTKRTELDTILKEDRIGRQSQKIRDAAMFGGPAGEVYVLVEGADDVVKIADELIAKIGTKPPAADAERLLRQLHEEDESASTGMGLFFTE